MFILYVLKISVFVHFANVVISVYAKAFFKIKVMWIY